MYGTISAENILVTSHASESLNSEVEQLLKEDRNLLFNQTLSSK